MNGFIRGTAITPHDTTQLTAPHQALYIGLAAAAAAATVDVAVQFVLGTTVVFAGVQSGTVLPMQVKRVMATGTTANVTVIALHGQ